MTRPEIDVSHLTDVPFDHHSITWWGTLGFIVAEGFTLALAAAAYVYLRQNEFDWPPGRTPDPDLLLPTVNTVLLLLIIFPLAAADRAARKMDRAGVTRWLLVGTLMTVPAVVLRWFDLQALNASYDAHAYASAAWALVVLHGTLLVTDLFETGMMWWLFRSGDAQNRHYPDVSDAALYQYYLSLGWLPLYLLVYWGPRVF